MSFVRTQDEIREMLAVLAKPRFPGRMLSVQFLTDPEFVRHVLPAPLEPVEQPLASAFVGDFGSNCVGDFMGAGIFVRARYQDIEADYCLSMPMSTATAIIFGRDLFAEPKRMRTFDLDVSGDDATGVCRNGSTEIVRIEAELGGPPPADVDLSGLDHFHFKYTLSADGSGLDHDPKLIHVHFETALTTARLGTGSLKLTGTKQDYLDEIPVNEVLAVLYLEGDLRGKAANIAETDKEAFLPYAFGKHDRYDLYAQVPELAGVR